MVWGLGWYKGIDCSYVPIIQWMSELPISCIVTIQAPCCWKRQLDVFNGKEVEKWQCMQSEVRTFIPCSSWPLNYAWAIKFVKLTYFEVHIVNSKNWMSQFSFLKIWTFILRSSQRSTESHAGTPHSGCQLRFDKRQTILMRKIDPFIAILAPTVKPPISVLPHKTWSSPLVPTNHTQIPAPP